MVEHGSLSNFAGAFTCKYFSNKQRTIAFTANVSFDASLSPILTMFCGSRLFVVPESIRRDPDAFVDFAEANGIQGVDCAPTQLELWMSAGLLDGAVPLETVVVGGEKVSTSLWRRLSRLPACQAFNMYGPTEGTIDATFSEITRDVAPSIGKPFDNVRVYVLDDCSNLVPVGAIGEICIGGVGVARGYVGRPELTAERFVDDPFVAGSRMYRTGDIGRWKRDGRLDYQGRRDDQVKLRGHRIELEEVAQTLRAHRAVDQALVRIVTDDQNIQSLVAYVTVVSPVEPRELRNWCHSRLPAFMIPRDLAYLSDMPIMANGKVDESVLRSHYKRSEVVTAHTVVSPSEMQVLQAMSAVLNEPEIRVDDDFFHLGGHSLLAVRLVDLLQRSFEKSVPLILVFEQPSARGLAAAIDAL
jgi:acyl-coenzyme A synthetase/AMP-(fatty) acid ligase/acyl carrier protein